MSNNGAAPSSVPPKADGAVGGPLIVANIKTLTGKVVQVALPPDLTDDELLQVIMEISKSLSVRARTERAQAEAQGKGVILRAPAGLRVNK